jgi:preprotein translocase subunit SecD
MFRLATWKVAAILALVFCAALLIVPSFLPESAVTAIESRLPSFVPFRPIVLGLDLQGGAHILMEVDSPSVIKTQVDSLRDDVRAKMREGKISISGGISELPRGVVVRIADPTERARALGLLRALDSRVGGALTGATGHTLDISDNGDGAIQLQLTEAATTDKVRHAVSQSIEVLNRRLNGAGTKETNVQQQGADRILIEVPGLQDTTKVKDLLGATAKLEFRLVADPGDPPSESEVLPQVQGGTITVQKRVMVAGEDLTDAQPSFDSRTGEPDVNFRFNLRGGQKFGQVTSENVGKLFAIVLDGKVISAPRILGPITGGSGQITGNFTVDKADELAILLRAGALPAKLTVVEERTVGPGLGQDSIDAGKRAYPADLRLNGAPRRNPDIARHRRHRLHHRHGGRFQRAYLRAHPRGGASWSLGRLGARRWLPTRLRHHRRLQRDDVRRGGDPLSVWVGRGARLRGVAWPGHSHFDHHRGDNDAHDDRAVVSP